MISPIPKDSPFTAPYDFFGTGRKYSENVWSARLANSLNNYYLMNEFTFTAKDSAVTNSNILGSHPNSLMHIFSWDTRHQIQGI